MKITLESSEIEKAIRAWLVGNGILSAAEAESATVQYLRNNRNNAVRARIDTDPLNGTNGKHPNDDARRRGSVQSSPACAEPMTGRRVSVSSRLRLLRGGLRAVVDDAAGDVEMAERI